MLATIAVITENDNLKIPFYINVWMNAMTLCHYMIDNVLILHVLQ